MDNAQIPSFEIPKSAEATPVYSGGEEFDPSLSVEGTREILPAPSMVHSQQNPMQGTAPGGLPQQVSPPLQPTTVADMGNSSHIIADDVDVIEKEWVERAKKIISLTSDDPYAEAKEIGKLKATYLKKRFNKDIPLAEDGVN